MDTLEHILKKYGLKNRPVIEIPQAGRNDLALLLHEFDFRVGVEVGVQVGRYSEVILKANPQMKLYSIDPWLNYKPYHNEKNQQLYEKLYDVTKHRLAPYPNSEIIRLPSAEALKRFEDESIDFVYIDANHEYLAVRYDIRDWSRKVRKGGIIAGHDYHKSINKDTLMYVWYAVNDYVRDFNISPLIIWGIKKRKKTPGEIRDKCRSWSWVKT